MKQNDEKKDAKVMTLEELENVNGGKRRRHHTRVPCS